MSTSHEEPPKKDDKYNFYGDNVTPEVFKTRSMMSNLWSSSIFLLNLYMLVTCLYWAATGAMPGQGLLFITACFEILLVFEVVLRILTRIFNKQAYIAQNFLHTRVNDGFISFSLSIIGSCPVSLIFVGMENGGNNMESLFSRLMLIKVLRAFEIYLTIEKIEEILFYKKFKTLVIVKFIKNFMQIILITHIEVCAFLFVQQIRVTSYTVVGTDPYNPYFDNEVFFQREQVNLGLQQYADGMSWAVATLLGCSFGDVTPHHFYEIVLSLLTFVVGMVMLAKVFSDFVALKYLLEMEATQKKKKLEQALKLCEVMKTPARVKEKIQTYYSMHGISDSSIYYSEAITGLPKSLYTEIMLSQDKNMFNRTNIFNFGSPGFVVAAAQCFRPLVATKGDFVIKAGQIAEDMFFIKSGEVEVLATDEETQIAIMKEGSFFGEIGLLLTGKRTVSIRALTFCIFETINKNDFNELMHNHPHELKFLLKIANQRIQTCNTEDIIEDEAKTLDEDEVNTYKPMMTLNNLDSVQERARKKKSLRTRTTNMIGLIWKKFVDIMREYGSSNRERVLSPFEDFMILPLSQLDTIWAIILIIQVGYDIIIVPFGIAFSAEFTNCGAYITFFEVTHYLIYFLDMFFHAQTAIKHKDHYQTDRKYVLRKYFAEKLLCDVLSVMPIDYIMYITENNCNYYYYTKLLRVFKIPRVYSILEPRIESAEEKFKHFGLLILSLTFILLNHIAACIMYGIANTEYTDYGYIPHGNMVSLLICIIIVKFSQVDDDGVTEVPINIQSVYVKYANFIYWIFTVSSSGASGDITGESPGEKIFQSIMVLLFRIYVAFLAAEAEHIVTTAYLTYSKNLAKVTSKIYLICKEKMYERWMNHLKLPESVMERVRSHNQYHFSKYQGMNEDEILNDLPKGIKNEILQHLLSDLLSNVGIFPKTEAGLYPDLLQRFHFIIISKGEYVFKTGETGEEIYFIIEGEVAITNDLETKTFAVLKKNDSFGEGAIIQGKPGVRPLHAKATANCTLAVLDLVKLQEIWEKYPVVKQKVIDLQSTKNQTEEMNEKRKLQNKMKQEKEREEELKRQRELEEQKERENEADLLREQEIEQQRQIQYEEKKPYDTEVSVGIETMKEIPKRIETEGSVHLDPSRDLDSPKRDSPQRGISKNMSIENEINNKPLNSPNHILTKSRYFSHSNAETQDQLSIKIPSKSDENIPKKQGESLSPLLLKSPQLFKNGSLDSTRKKSDTIQKDTIETKPNVSATASKEELNRTENFSFFKILAKIEEGFEKHRPVILNIILLWSFMYYPLVCAFPDVTYNGFPLAFEILVNICLMLNLIVDIKKYQEQNVVLVRIVPDISTPQRTASHDQITILTIIVDLIYLPPISLIFQEINLDGRNSQWGLVLVQLIRCAAIDRLKWIFHLKIFKKRYALGNILLIIYCWILINHMIACIFIVLANAHNNFNTSWLSKVPAPQFDFPHNWRATFDVEGWTVYIHALYWSYLTTSHVGGGDVVGVNADEKVYSTIIIMCSLFLYAFVFGNLASIVDDFTPKYQKKYEGNYKHVLSYAQTSKLDNFIKRIHIQQYYNYLWEDARGIPVTEILNSLPNSIKYDIFSIRYKLVIQSCSFFMKEHGKIEMSIFYSFCKKVRWEIYLPEDYIFAAGQEINDIFVIFEGEVLQCDLSNGRMTKLEPGAYFGGIVPNIVQLTDYKSNKVSKVAVLSEAHYRDLKDAFPEWADHVLKNSKLYKIGQRVKEGFKKLQEENLKNGKSNKECLVNSNSKASIASKSSKPNSQKGGKTPISDEQDPIKMFEKLEERYKEEIYDSKKGIKVPMEILTRDPSKISFRSDGEETRLRQIKYQRMKANLLMEGQGPSFDDSEQNNNSQLGLLDDIDEKQEKMKIPSHQKYSLPETKEDKTKQNSKLKPPVLENDDSLSQDETEKKRKKRETPKISVFQKIEDEKQPAILAKDESLISGDKELVTKPKEPISEKEESNILKEPLHKREMEVEEDLTKLSKVPTASENKQDITGPGLDSVSVSGGRGTLRASRRRQPFAKFSSQNSKASALSKLTGFLMMKKKLEQTGKLRFYIDPGSRVKIAYEIIHMFMILYSIFVIPFIVGFRVNQYKLLFVEAAILFEQIMYILLQLRTAQYAYGVLTLDLNMIFRGMLDKGFVVEMIALFPFNLLFGSIEVYNPRYIVDILRVNRVILIVRLESQLTLFASYVPQAIKYLAFMKPIIYLAFVWHVTSCLWIWLDQNQFNDLNEMCWFSLLDLTDAQGWQEYMYSLLFTMNIATTTGYKEMIIYNNYERILFILFIYLGDALFALVFGLFRANSRLLPEKYDTVFERIRKIEGLLEHPNIKFQTRQKIENYFAYSVNSASHSETALEALTGLMPSSTIKQMEFHQIHDITNFPLMHDFCFNRSLTDFLVEILEKRVYLPNDFIISRVLSGIFRLIGQNDIGEEMYFLGEGTAFILSPNERRVLSILETGSYFGELSLYIRTFRLSPIIASTFCIVYVLKRTAFQNLLKKFPAFEAEYSYSSEDALDEMKTRTKHTQNHYNNLRYLTLKNFRRQGSSLSFREKSKETQDKELRKILQAIEIPYDLVKKDKKIVKSHINSKDLKKVISEALGDIESWGKRDESEESDIAEEFVERDEIKCKAMETKKTTLRIKVKGLERRCSRQKLGKEVRVSLVDGMNVKWGINMDH